MTIEYEDVVRSINHAYWQTLLDNDAAAREQAAQLAQRYGFQANAADTMIEAFSRQPLQEWLAQMLDTETVTEPAVNEPAVEHFSHQPKEWAVQGSAA